jgi:hypothetical protein
VDGSVRHYAVALALTLTSFGALAQPAFDPTTDPAPAGYLKMQIASIAAGSAVEDFNALATPDLVVGDWYVMPDVTTPGSYAVTLFSDGHIEYADGEDDSRQTLDGWAWDVSAGTWHAEEFDFVANNIAPVCGATLEAVLLVDAAMTSIDLNALCTDGEDDVLTFTLDSGTLPTGLSIMDGVISGTPTVEDEAGETLVYVADDGYGGSTTQELFLLPLETLPATDCTTAETQQGDCEAAFESDFSNAVSFDISTQQHDTIAEGVVISQSPIAGAEMAPFSTVDLLVSLGPCGGNMWNTNVWTANMWATGIWSARSCDGTPTVTVPDVVGDLAADADTALEAVDLDTGTVTPQCSVQALNTVLSQNPPAGASVVVGALVDIWTSTGVACVGGKLLLDIRRKL